MASKTSRACREDLDYRTFGIALRDLLIERSITTRLGSPDWPGFSKRVPGIHYETLRKAVTGDRAVAPKIIEAVAAELEVKPELFAEYRLWQLRCTFDPGIVGAQPAITNLAQWEKRRD